MPFITTFFSFLRHALGTSNESIDLSALTESDWHTLIDLSFNQGVASITVDGFGTMAHNFSDNELEIDKVGIEDTKYEWFGACFEDEKGYAERLNAIEKLASFYNEQSIRMLIIKGYGLSLNYPVPNHRSSGDIDIYLFGNGNLGDLLVNRHLGCDVKQNENKHSLFYFDGISIENHACFIYVPVHPSLGRLNDFLVEEAEKSVEHQVGAAHILLPTAMFNALFIPFHCAGHFVRGESSVRQLCDWACFVLKHSFEIDWDIVEAKTKEAGFWQFFCCLNGIVQDYLGVPSSLLPEWPRDKKLEKRMIDDILAPRKQVTTLVGKVYRFFSSGWKYRMVFKDSILIASFKQAKAYLRKQDDDAVSIWEM